MGRSLIGAAKEKLLHEAARGVAETCTARSVPGVRRWRVHVVLGEKTHGLVTVFRDEKPKPGMRQDSFRAFADVLVMFDE